MHNVFFFRPSHVVSEKTQVHEAAKPRMRIPVVLHQTFFEEPVPGRIRIVGIMLWR